MARGVGAFIEGAFGGYQWGEDLKNTRSDRRRRDRLDEISEEQRAIDNRRADLRDRILNDEHSYNQTVRDQALADDAAMRAAYRDAAGATDAAVAAPPARADTADVTLGPQPPTSPAVAANAPVVSPGGAGNVAPGGGTAPQPRGAMAQGGSQTTDLTTAILAAEELVRRAEEARDPQAIAAATAARDELYARAAAERAAQGQQPPVEPLMTPEQRNLVTSMAPANANPPSQGGVPIVPTAVAPQSNPIPRPRGVMTDPGPLSPAGGPRTVNGPPSGAPAAPIDPNGQTRPVVNPMLAVGTPGGPSIREAMPPAAPTAPTIDPNGQTREPVVNPMRAVGVGGVRGVPITEVMPPAARDQAQTAAPAAAERLDQTGTASGKLMADAMRNDPDARVGQPQISPRGAAPGASLSNPPARGARKTMPQAPKTWAETFVDVGVPIIEEQMLRAGRPDLAVQWRTWADSEVARDGYEAYARAGLAAARGDITGFADAVQELYDSPYMPDGWEADRKASQFYQDSEGNIIGAQIVLRNSDTGELRVENYETLDELVSDLLLAVSPEAAFQAHIARQDSSRQAAIEQAARAEADATATADAIMKQVASMDEAYAASQLGQAPQPGDWGALSPAEKVAQAAEIVRAAQRAAQGQAPATGGGNAPAAPMEDWTG